MSNKYWEFKNQTSTEALIYILYIEVASWAAGSCSTFCAKF